MSRGGPLSPCPICHSLSALHLPQNLEEEKRGLITLEPGLTAAVQLEFSWNFYLRNSSRCNHQALALGIGLKKWLLSEIVLVMMSIKYQLNIMYSFSGSTYLCTYSHCPFSSNLFHGHIVQKYIDQMSPPGNKKCSPGKVFRIKPPSNPWTFEQERP